MVPLIRQEVVNNNFMSIDDFIDFIAISESTPGPLAVNMSTYVGYISNGLLGAFVSTLDVVLPGFIIILLISKFYDKYKDNVYIKNLMTNLKPVIIGLIIATFISLAINVFNIEITNKLIVSILIFIICLILSKLNKSTILLIVLSGLLGILSGLIGLI